LSARSGLAASACQHALFEGLSARMAHFVAALRSLELLPESRLVTRT
jgi:hypothetical protein